MRHTGGDGQKTHRDPQVLPVVTEADNPRPPDNYAIAEDVLNFPSEISSEQAREEALRLAE